MKYIRTLAILCLIPGAGWADPPTKQSDSIDFSRLQPIGYPEPSDEASAAAGDGVASSEPSDSPASDNTDAEDSAQQRIRDALQNGAPAAGSGLLGDVLDVIRRRGSILDGSVLDPRAERVPNAPKTGGSGATPMAPYGVNPPRLSASTPALAAAPVAVDSESARVRAAESLLRSARLLESLAKDDPINLILVRQMRTRATQLLIELYATPTASKVITTY